jgi:hypothetical protein
MCALAPASSPKRRKRPLVPAMTRCGGLVCDSRPTLIGDRLEKREDQTPFVNLTPLLRGS